MDEREAFIRAQQPALIRAGYLLTGSDAAAQDLVQETLVKVIVGWRAVRRAGAPEAYVRTILLNAFLASQRRSWWRERPAQVLPEPAEVASAYDAVADRDMLARALQALPARQRAAVVLRHYEDRSEAQTAELLGCSVGTVKSLTSRGLAGLRTLMNGAVP